MTPIALLILLYGRGPIFRESPMPLRPNARTGGREARFNPSTGVWQIFDGDRCVGEVRTREEALTRVTDPSACLAMGPDRYPANLD